MGIYTQIALCVIGMTLYFNAGKIEARGGGADRSVLWACLSLATSLAVLWTGAGWILWALAQAALFIGIALTHVALEGRGV